MICNLAIASIQLYKYFVAPYLPECCIFKVTCSEYTKLAIIKYGFFQGLFKGLVRLLHCHPFIGMITKSNFEEI